MSSAQPNDRRSTPPPPVARSVDDACTMLGICRAMLYRLKAKGQIRTIKIGRRTLVPQTEIDRLVATGAP